MKVQHKRFLCDKRAITPVLSNLLLMVVAVAAMAIATTSTYVVTTNLRENMSERLLVEDVWFNSTDSIMIISATLERAPLTFQGFTLTTLLSPSVRLSILK